ncbi:MAG: hypothetical protein IJU79_03940 [Desulfovibrionaceae bacterium]|nr:hypothetical protein [Desulfovibrionaceae bacterium]
MKHTACTLPYYAADISGVCSALYELGGLVVIHDASGCNSTYSTFDEPRWLTLQSAIYISGLTEIDAIMGQDDKLLQDIIATSELLHPKFIALCASPMPLVLGTDFAALSLQLKARTNLPCVHIPTTGIHPYSYGLSLAWLNLCQALQPNLLKATPAAKDEVTINILGSSPLDQTQELLSAVLAALTAADFKINVNLGFNFKDATPNLLALGNAKANLVLSESGLALAKWLNKELGMPYVVGVPIGKFAPVLFEHLRQACHMQVDPLPIITLRKNLKPSKNPYLIIGEPVLAASIACALHLEFAFDSTLLCPCALDTTLLSANDLMQEEDEAYFTTLFTQFKNIIADPLYADILGSTTILHPLAHVAFSGRLSLQYTGADLIGPTLTPFLARSLP